MREQVLSNTSSGIDKTNFAFNLYWFPRKNHLRRKVLDQASTTVVLRRLYVRQWLVRRRLNVPTQVDGGSNPVSYLDVLVYFY